jgi:hypothetical protein
MLIAYRRKYINTSTNKPRGNYQRGLFLQYQLNLTGVPINNIQYYFVFLELRQVIKQNVMFIGV